MLNNICLQGRLVAEPELATTKSGKEVAKFRLAVERNQKNAEGNRDTDFITCLVWGNQAKLVYNYFGKGQMMVCSGSLQSRSYEKNGEKRVAYEVVVDKINFAGEKQTKQDSKPAAKKAPAPAKSASFNDYDIIGDEEDLPF